MVARGELRIIAPHLVTHRIWGILCKERSDRHRPQGVVIDRIRKSTVDSIASTSSGDRDVHDFQCLDSRLWAAISSRSLECSMASFLRGPPHETDGSLGSSIWMSSSGAEQTP